MASTESLFEHYYYSRPGFLGGTRTFHQICRQQAPSNGKILEIGAGPTNETTAVLSTLGTVCGVDISKTVLGNKYLCEAKVFDGSVIPYPDNSFDFCASDFVLEHVERPDEHFREVARVLKPGGRYCARTMNLRHYVTLASRAIPNAMHLSLSGLLRRMPKNAHDPYPTFYRANSRPQLIELAKRTGLAVQQLTFMEPEPSYGRAHPLLFYPMMCYERIVNSTERLAGFRVTLFVVLTKV